ncbi:nuclear transcription factor Y subunit B-3 isoform X2 [Medicago truncatula]|uniref:nuclear transcription factor Y subunit B-3 isoform X2 n=1 Tax=Medicago truncatula TaxID=3880 RepID=UPI001966FEA5|nr:nuclear transcription factor Y subunit B-3 isoform X2 [Medicago truncatula]
METGGGFHGYRKLPTNTNSSVAGTLKLSSVSEMNTRQQVGEQNNNGTEQDNECIVREQDRFMPIANVIRIMRKILPPHAKISDDAKETIQECVSEYISFITGEANERCQREQRKTITAEDVLWAMSKLGFDDYIEPLTMYLHRYRELEGDRTSMRVEPLGKRGMEYGNLGGFVPQFHIGHPNGGYYGNAAPTYMMRDGNNNNNNNNNAPNAANAAGGSSHSQALANAEANGHHHHHQYK